MRANRFCTIGLSAVASLLWGTGAAGSWTQTIPAVKRGAPQPPTLKPVWVARLEPQIEWVQRVGRGPSETLMVATSNGRIQLVDPGTGQARLSEPFNARPGVRAVEADRTASTGPSDLAYCFDRYAIYALALSDRPGIKWQYGPQPQPGEQFDDDPELLTGWSSAAVTDAGILAVDSRGTIVLLSALDGQVRWQLELGRLPTARLHVRGEEAAVLWKREGQTHAAFVDLRQHPPALQERTLGATWPTWSALLPEGLLTLAPTEAALWPRQGPPRRLSIPPANLPAAAADVFQADGTLAEGSATPKALLLAADRNDVVAYDVSTGQQCWLQRSDCPLTDLTLALPIQTLTVCGNRCVAASPSGIIVYDAATGQRLGCYQLPGPPTGHEHPMLAPAMTAWTIRSPEAQRQPEDGGLLYVLYRGLDDPQGCWQLVQVELEPTGHGEGRHGARGTGRPSLALGLGQEVSGDPTRPQTRPALRATCWLEFPGEVRQVAWMEKQLVLAGVDTLRAYQLP